ncbi:ATP-binding protein [Stigmatella aurantiaca]|uniref:histidine kinase n=1 Tax=Stigmatella aurantiaca (strain DW4/3-1) TaxID=378806 RepID=Q08V63_STIAD|nr:ATP-binding protein [Stigmatella aurantiaca]ADO74975.1 Sensor protein [Stigmatella aurantiaca DW4/3-1]EAU64370.1 cell cycle histidine kinase CckA [Stigmatella aurantiaca DW4/3-1]
MTRLRRLLGEKPLTVKLAGLLSAVILATILSLSISLISTLTSNTEDLLHERAKSLATVMATLVSAAIEFEHTEAATERLSALAKSPDAIYAAIYAPDGTRLAQWGEVPPSSPFLLPVLIATSKMDHHHLQAAVPVGDTLHSSLVIAFSRAEQHRQAAAIIQAALLTSGLLLPIMILLGVLVATSIVQPIRAMTGIADAIARGDRIALSQLPSSEPDESGTLARAFHRLLVQEHENQSLLEARVEERTQALQKANAELALRLRQLAEAQEQLVQTGKMAAVGQLAGGVAHEINNPLAVILGFAQGMDRRVPENDPMRLPVRSIVREALRCKNLVQELLTFSRVGKKNIESVDLNALVRSTLVLVEARARTQEVKILQDFAATLPILQGNKTQLQQVLVNLGTNALDVMKGGGTLTVRTYLQGTESVCLEVTDTGSGIPEEVRSRIFDPFFTTKPVGEGTGLGLSLVYEIVQQHRGQIEVESQIGVGTTMRVKLPVSSSGAASA